MAHLAHTIAQNKLQARWKNCTPPTQARKICGVSMAHIIWKIYNQVLWKNYTRNAHLENRLDISCAERKIVQSIWIEKLYLTHRKTFSIYRHRNNCVGIVYGNIVGCLRKNICIVVVNESATEKLELVKLRQLARKHSPPKIRSAQLS